MATRSREFSRRMWASSRARGAWEPRLMRAAAAWHNLELQTVTEGLRPAALVFGRARVEAWGNAYLEVDADRFAVGPGAKALSTAYQARDDERVGALLGFPACCRLAFAATWGAGTGDTTWAMSRGGIETTGPLECNILGRWLDMRWVMHLPCSFTCEATRALGVAHRALLRAKDPQAADVIDEVLQWPVEWSALHGAAEIRYPVLKVVTRTGYTAERRIVQRRGRTYPAEGARGLAFPYSEAGMPVSTENGFPTVAAQDAAHMMVLQALRSSPPQGPVLDLGAGNGLLMQRIASTFLRPVSGIEIDPIKAAKHPAIVVADLRSANLPTVDTAVVSLRRFEEIPTLRARIHDHARQVFVYSYDEPLFARLDGER